MSRIGKRPIKLPSGVSVDIVGSGLLLKCGESVVSRIVPSSLKCFVVDGALCVEPATDVKIMKKGRDADVVRSRWGLFREILANDVHGISDGFLITLDVSGVGYKAFIDKENNSLTLNLGYSHDLVVPIPLGVTVNCVKNIVIEIRGSDNVVLGDFSARLEALRVPDPYDAKGIIRRGSFVRKISKVK